MKSKIEPLARAGYAARGVVYLIVGLFAVLAALSRQEAQGSEGALQVILRQPFGTILVWLMIFGLVGYAIWRLVQAVNDPDRHGKDAKGLAIRAGLLASGVLHAALAFFALGLVSVWGRSEGGGDPTAGPLAAIFGAEYAWVFVWGLALIVAGVGAAFIWKGATAGFMKYFQCPGQIMRWLKPLSQFGLIARGVVFLIVAFLIVTGGSAYDSESRPGLQEALKAVQGWAFGWIILLVIAVGLLAFGLYSLAEARYRRIKVE